jgi:hypothetical protein
MANAGVVVAGFTGPGNGALAAPPSSRAMYRALIRRQPAVNTSAAAPADHR